MSSRLAKRICQHAMIGVISAIALIIVYSVVPGDDKKYLWSMSTAYTSFLLLGVTLALGPINILRRRNNPVSSDLRRDFGIWCGIIGIIHVIVGIQVHMGNFLLYFFKAVEGPEAFNLRSDLFGTANYIGLLATIVLILLLALSNDLSLRLLASRRWKKIQQWNYALFFLIAAHAIMFQVIEKRIPGFIITLAVLVSTPIVIQTLGVRRVSKNKLY